MTERLQKYLARMGAGSRREIENWIRAGRISIDGHIATLGVRVDQNNQIVVDGRLIRKSVASTKVPRVIIYHKPPGEICTRDDPKARPTVFQRLPKLQEGRWVSVGRLDFNTAGLLLFTTDGGLANRLMHPRFGVEREYLCRLRGEASSQQIDKLLNGILLDGRLSCFQSVERRNGSNRNCWYEVVVREGRYREVRRLWSAVNCTVSRLVRIRYGMIRLPRYLRPGDSRELQENEVKSLLQSIKIDDSSFT